MQQVKSAKDKTESTLRHLQLLSIGVSASFRNKSIFIVSFYSHFLQWFFEQPKPFLGGGLQVPSALPIHCHHNEAVAKKERNLIDNWIFSTVSY